MGVAGMNYGRTPPSLVKKAGKVLTAAGALITGGSQQGGAGGGAHDGVVTCHARRTVAATMALPG
jgi:hypothetical protein